MVEEVLEHPQQSPDGDVATELLAQLARGGGRGGFVQGAAAARRDQERQVADALQQQPALVDHHGAHAQVEAPAIDTKRQVHRACYRGRTEAARAGPLHGGGRGAALRVRVTRVG